MNLYEEILKGQKKLALIGLGYVGLPIAVEFSKKGVDVIGFDVNSKKVQLYKNGIDPTGEVGDEQLSKTKVFFTSNEADLDNADFFIVAVPTPVNLDHTPNLTPVVEASKIVGRHIKKKSIVVYESTVYPGCTEDVCVPILEAESKLRCKSDFKIGYSPERINPGDKIHTLKHIVKVVSGCDIESLSIIKSVYEIVIEAGTYPVSNIRTAEAIKVVENSQRDINIAFMNELAMVFDRMDIDTEEVINGMNTKWNALGFRPGLVGGHCIGVDPYYFTYQAEKLGYHSNIILNGRIVNDSIASFIVNSTIKLMVKNGLAPKNCRIGILGITFKENCPDIRNSKVADIYKGLEEYGCNLLIADPFADPKEVKKEYGIKLNTINDFVDMDCIIVAVSHSEYKNISIDSLKNMFGKKTVKIVIDVKSIFNQENLLDQNIISWRL